MLNLRYLQVQYAEVKGGSKDLLLIQGKVDSGVSKARLMLENLKKTYGNWEVKLYIAESDNIYKFIITKGKKYEIGSLYYIPKDRRLDIWDTTYGPAPLVQFRARKVEYKQYSPLLEGSGIEKLWDRLSSIL